MADYNDLINKLNEQGVDVNIRNTKKIKTPADQPDKKEEIEYNFMDLICGIAGAALFGDKNMGDASKLSSLINGIASEKSLYSYIQNIKNDVSEIKNILDGVTKNNTLCVKLIDKNIGGNIAQNNFYSGSSNNIADSFASLIRVLQSKEGINKNTINYLKKSLGSGGDLYNIFENLNKIGDNDKYKEIQEYIYNLNSIIDSLIKITNIGFIGRFQIKRNLNFIKDYINEDLLDIIHDIDNNFKNTTPSKIQGLYNVNELFDIISSLGQIDTANKVKMYVNLKFIKTFLLNDLLSLFDGINNVFSNSTIENIPEKIDGLFIKILNSISIDKELFNESNESLNLINQILKGNNYSNGLIGIIKKIDNLSSKFDSSINNLDSIKTFFDELQIIIKSIIQDNVTSSINLLYSEIDALRITLSDISNIDVNNIEKVITNTINILENLNKNLDKNEYFDSLLTRLSITKDTADDINNTIKILNGLSNINVDNKKLVDFFNDLEKIETILSKFNTNSVSVNSGIESLKSISETLTTVFETLNKLNPESIRRIIDMMEEIEKFLVISTGLVLLIGITGIYIDFTSIVKFGAAITALFGIVGLFITWMSKLSTNDLKNISILLPKITELILTLSGILLIVGLVSHNIDFATIGGFWLATTAFLLTIGGFITALLFIPSLAIKKALKVIDSISTLITEIGITFGIIALVSKFTNFRDLFAFEFLFATLLFIVGRITFGLSKLKYDKEQKNVTNFSSLILSLSIALALGALVSKFIHINEIITFGLLLAGLIAVVSIPLYVISKNGSVLIQGADDLGKLILCCTAGLLIGALFMLNDELAIATLKFAGLYIVFVSGILLAVGLASKLAGDKALEGMEGLSKVILYATGAMLIGGALFMNDEFKKHVIDFAVTLGIFIGGVSLAVGFAIKLMGNNALNTIIALNVLIVTIAGMLTFSAYVIKDIDKMLIWNFIGQVFALVIGMTGIILILSHIDKSKLSAGALALSLIGIVIMGLGLVFSILYKTMANTNANQTIIWNFIAQSLVLVGGIGVIMFLLGKMSIASILKGILAISLIGLIIMGLSYVFGYIGDKLMKYDNVVGKMWSITMSMLGIVAVFLLATAAIGLLLAGPQAILVGIGILAIGLTALIMLGMAHTFGVIMEIEQQYGLSTNDNILINAIDGMFNVIEHALNKVINLQTKMNVFGEGNSILGKLGGMANNALGFIGMFFAVPKLMVIGLTVLTLWASAQALKNLNEVMPDKAGIELLKNKIDVLFTIIEDAVKRIINLNTANESSFFSRILSKIPVVGTAVNGLDALGKSGIIGGTILSLLNATEGINKLNQKLPDMQSLIDIRFRIEFFCQSIDRMIKTINDINKSNSSIRIPFISNVIDKILPKKDDPISTAIYTLNNVSNSFTDLSKKLLTTEQLSQLKTKIINSLSLFNDKEIKDAFNADISIRDISKTKYLFNTTTKIIADIYKMQTNMPQNISELSNNIIQLIGTYIAITNKLITEIEPQSNKITKLFSKRLLGNDGPLELMYNFIKKSLKLVDDHNNENEYNIFADGLAKIYIETIGKISENTVFNQHTETLKTYVETINSIDISKVDKLTNLTESLNNFGNRFEDMGSFVRAISIDLTSVLTHLADKMTEAKETIKNADNLNEKRKVSINESVKKITDLMKQKLIVNIENTSSENNTNTVTTPSITSNTGGNAGGTTTTPGEGIPASDPGNTTSTGSTGSIKPVYVNNNNNTIEELLRSIIIGNKIRVTLDD